jgi:DNA-binding IclR family transcriptional regulator
VSASGAYFVTRTLPALELLAVGPLSAPQLAAAMQINDRTARRMLARLADEEYVTRLDEPRRRYALTMRVVAVAGQWLEHSELPPGRAVRGAAARHHDAHRAPGRAQP